MSSQNQYQAQAVSLAGGLDLTTPSVVAAPGTLTDCFNFERTDRLGYSRVFGYERYDGGPSPSSSYTNLVYLSYTSTSLPATREPISFEGAVFGHIVEATSTGAVAAITKYDVWRRVQNNVPATVLTPNASVTVTGAEEYEVFYKRNKPDANSKDSTEDRNRLFKKLNTLVQAPANGERPIIGLHSFKNQQYAVVGMAAFTFNDGNTPVYPGSLISNHNSVAHVRDVVVESGSWTGGDASGHVLVEGPLESGSYNLGEGAGAVLNVLTITGPTDTDRAGLWRTEHSGGWRYVDTGYVVGFKNGTEYGPPVVYDRGEIGDSIDTDLTSESYASGGYTTDSSYQGSPVAGDAWSLNGPSIAAALKPGQTGYVSRQMYSSPDVPAYTFGTIVLNDFENLKGFYADDSINVTGIEVRVVARSLTSSGEVPVRGGVRVVPHKGGTPLTGASEEYSEIEWDGGPFWSSRQTLVFGGDSFLFGVDPEEFRESMDSTWGLIVTPEIRKPSATEARNGSIEITSVEVRVHFSITISNYYFNNGTDDVTAKIVNYNVEDGAWESEDARGEWQVVEVEPHGAASRSSILAGDEVWTAPNKKGLKLADIAGDMRLASIPGLPLLQEKGSRYQFLTANFYANEDYEGMYAVSGAGRGFSYDGYYMRYIYAIPDPELDSPRHVAFHQGSLVLGYAAGSVLFSVPGEPLNYRGVEGAVEIGVGDPVTGMMRMNGTTLGVFCEKSIHGIVGTSGDNYSRQTLSPYEGAIEYTVVDMGRPVYCSYRGISVFDQTAAYGDFSGTRLSAKVSPWLLPRIQGTVVPLGIPSSASGPVVAIACRTKNQYRLYFDDGYRLTMTLVGGEGDAPEFTIQAEGLYENDGTFSGWIVPRAETSYVDNTGAERILIAHYDDAKSPPNNKYYVYEYERSWTFDGNGIPAYVVVEENFFGSPVDYDRFAKIRLHGMSLGYAPITVHVEPNYKDNANTLQSRQLLGYLSLPRVPTDVLGNSYNNFTNITNLASTGRSFNFRFMSYDVEASTTPSGGPAYSEVSPPFVMQYLLVQTKEGKGDI